MTIYLTILDHYHYKMQHGIHNVQLFINVAFNYSLGMIFKHVAYTNLLIIQLLILMYKHAKPLPVWMMHMSMFLLVFGDVRREAGRADGDGALRQDHGVVQEAQLWAQPGAPRPRAWSASGYTWASPPASSTSSPPRPPPRSRPPSLTMPPSRRGLLCPTCRQVEIVCVALVNREHSGRKLKD
uniref:Uncharacterized protein n=1 Tax=Triticum urartu TaxID=4572 RepID=A0A8R7Q6G7_TRIUA